MLETHRHNGGNSLSLRGFAPQHATVDNCHHAPSRTVENDNLHHHFGLGLEIELLLFFGCQSGLKFQITLLHKADFDPEMGSLCPNDTANIIHEKPFVKYLNHKNSIIY